VCYLCVCVCVCMWCAHVRVCAANSCCTSTFSSLLDLFLFFLVLSSILPCSNFVLPCYIVFQEVGPLVVFLFFLLMLQSKFCSSLLYFSTFWHQTWVIISVAVCCMVLQCIAFCCSVLHVLPSEVGDDLHCTVAVSCSVLWSVAVCCSVLQCVALCCSVSHVPASHNFRRDSGIPYNVFHILNNVFHILTFYIIRI